MRDMLLYPIVLRLNVNCYSTYYHLECDNNLVIECQKDPCNNKINLLSLCQDMLRLLNIFEQGKGYLMLYFYIKTASN